MFADDFRMKGRGRRRRGGDPERLRRQHKARDVAAAIDRAVNSQRLVGVNDGDMRRTEEIEILKRLLGVGCLVASGYAERIVKLEAAFAPPLQINAAIFARERKISAVRFAT